MTRISSISKQVPIFISNSSNPIKIGYTQYSLNENFQNSQLSNFQKNNSNQFTNQSNEEFSSEFPSNLWVLHGSYQTRHTWDDFFYHFLKIDNNDNQEIQKSEIFHLDRQENNEFEQLNSTLTKLYSLNQIVAIDLRGHGESSYAPSYHVKDFSEDLFQLRNLKYKEWFSINDNIKELSINSLNNEAILNKYGSKDLIIGMSLGGLTTIDHWIRYGTGFGGVIVDITPHYKEYESMSPLQGMKFKTFDEWVKWSKKFNPNRSEESLRQRLKYSLMKNDDSDWVWRVDPKFGTFKNTNGIKYSEWIWEQLKLLKPSSDRTNVLIIRGGKSKITTPQEVEELVNVMNYGCDRKWVRWIEIKEAGHSVQGDAPLEFTKAVEEHISQIFSPMSKL